MAPPPVALYDGGLEPAAAGGDVLDQIAESIAPRRAPSADPLHALLSLQSAEGWFEADGIIDEQLRAAGKAWDAKQVDPDERVARTLAVLWLLHHRFSFQKREWNRAVIKAIRWLAKQTGKQVSQVRKWVDEVTRAS